MIRPFNSTARWRAASRRRPPAGHGDDAGGRGLAGEEVQRRWRGRLSRAAAAAARWRPPRRRPRCLAPPEVASRLGRRRPIPLPARRAIPLPARRAAPRPRGCPPPARAGMARRTRDERRFTSPPTTKAIEMLATTTTASASPPHASSRPPLAVVAGDLAGRVRERRRPLRLAQPPGGRGAQRVGEIRDRRETAGGSLWPGLAAPPAPRRGRVPSAADRCGAPARRPRPPCRPGRACGRSASRRRSRRARTDRSRRPRPPPAPLSARAPCRAACPSPSPRVPGGPSSCPSPSRSRSPGS